MFVTVCNDACSYIDTLWLSAKEVGTFLGGSKRAVHKRALAAGWRFKVTKGRGGEKKLYGLNSMPLEVQRAHLDPCCPGQPPRPARRLSGGQSPADTQGNADVRPSAPLVLPSPKKGLA